MYKRNLLFGVSGVFIVIVLMLSGSGCSDEGTNPEDKEFVLPDSNISFYEDIEPMFQVRCGLESGCHSPTDINSRFPYIILINKVSLINHQIRNGERLVDLNIHKNNPHLAPLYLILSEGYPTPFQDQMPPPVLNRRPLTENQINGIKQWIKEGAKD